MGKLESRTAMRKRKGERGKGLRERNGKYICIGTGGGGLGMGLPDFSRLNCAILK